MPAECRVHRLVADVALLFQGRVLLVKYVDTSRYDGQAGWYLPDDLLQHTEHPDRAAHRILKDQLGCRGLAVRLDHIESIEGGRWHLCFHYRSEPGLRPHLAMGENVAAAEWFPLDGLPPPEEMAHGGWARDILRRMTIAGMPARS